MRPLLGSLALVLFFGPFGLQFGSGPEATSLELKAIPTTTLRPYDRIVVQLVARAEIPTESGGDSSTQKVRVQASGASFRLANGDGNGWLSKPFVNTGGEQEPFYEEPGLSWARILLGRATRTLVVEDSVLYTAPAQPGRYRIVASIDSLSTTLEVEVDAEAEPVVAAETVSFDARAPEDAPSRDHVPPAEPYRELAQHYAPFIAQETWFDPKSDYLARFDFDGDWTGDNNWDQTPTGSSQAYVYYAAMETGSHWFLVYNFFHPRDYSDKCLPEMCHENDSEGLVLTIRKEGGRYGQLEAMETLAHNNLYSYRGRRVVGSAAHNLDGRIELIDESHPVVFVESGGHGVYGADDSHSRFDIDDRQFYEGTGVTYVYTGTAQRPLHPDARRVGYDLLPIYHHWWQRAVSREDAGRSFDDFFEYRPFGRGRPRTPYREIAGAFLGRAQGNNKAKPFWGWHDKRTLDRDILARGQWALDPAYAVSRNLMLPRPVSLDYVYNPYLGVGTPETATPFATRGRWRLQPRD